MRLKRTLLAGALLLGIADAAMRPAMAEPAAPPAEASDPAAATIVVTGQPRTGHAERRFVDALSRPASHGQLARFAAPVCPIAFGLEATDAGRVADRMRQVAAAVGMRVADKDCRPNIVLLVVPDRSRAIAHWRRNRADFFSGLTPRQIDEIAAGDGPVAAWQVVAMKGKGGRLVGRGDSDTFDYVVVPEATPYRIGSQIEFEFSGAFVLVEAAAVGDATPVQLADYAAMRSFAATDPAGAVDQALPTILTLFSGDRDTAPLSVTEHDVRYLTALYKTQIASRADDQQRAMAKAMAQGAAEAEAPDRE